MIAIGIAVRKIETPAIDETAQTHLETGASATAHPKTGATAHEAHVESAVAEELRIAATVHALPSAENEMAAEMTGIGTEIAIATSVVASRRRVHEAEVPTTVIAGQISKPVALSNPLVHQKTMSNKRRPKTWT